MGHEETPHAEASHVETLPRKLTWYNYKVVAFAAVGSIVYGYCLSAVATTLVSKSLLLFYMRHLTDSGPTNVLHVLWS